MIGARVSVSGSGHDHHRVGRDRPADVGEVDREAGEPPFVWPMYSPSGRPMSGRRSDREAADHEVLEQPVRDARGPAPVGRVEEERDDAVHQRDPPGRAPTA